MSQKRSIIKIMNKYLHEVHKGTIESYYGVGSKIKIHNITPSHSSGMLLIDAKVHLGDTINEEVLENDMCDLLVRESIEPIFPEAHIKVMISWDA